jgi:hypothetical protein
MKSSHVSLVFLLIPFALAYFDLSPQACAVSPAPDGCYPNYTTAEGCDALDSLTTGSGNTGLGWRALFLGSTASFNTGVGAGALALNNGDSNTSVGAAALLLNTTGMDNVGLGTDAMVFNDSGSFNTAIGVGALADCTTGSSNVAIGNGAGYLVAHGNNVICIGAGVWGDDVSNTTWIGNVYGVTTQSGNTAPVVVSDGGQLATVASSERFKKDIALMANASEAILALRPVTFHYKSDTRSTAQFGLIAEEVAKVNPALVLPDKEGKPYSVRYEAVNAMLLNEFLKEHRKVEQLEAAVAKLTGMVEKVSAQVELRKATPETVSR